MLAVEVALSTFNAMLLWKEEREGEEEKVRETESTVKN